MEAQSRSRFWIISVPTMVKSICNKCVKCRKKFRKLCGQSMKDLPIERLQPSPVMLEAAQIVNQKPIGRHPTSPDDGSYLCPNDLLGRALPNVPQGPFQERSSQQFWFDYIQEFVECSWKKWTRNYFPGIIVRQKWHVDKRNVKWEISS